MQHNLKDFLERWCKKKNLLLSYEANFIKERHHTCECHITSHDYKATGSAGTRKVAMTNAAKDMLKYLVRTGELKEEEVPEGMLGEDPDFDAELHGNWKMVHAKTKLHSFLQQNHIDAYYKFTEVGSDKSGQLYNAEVSFRVEKLDTVVSASGLALSKHMASKICALSIIRQLFHLGAIDAVDAGAKKRIIIRKRNPTFEVKMSSSDENEVRQAFTKLNVNSVVPQEASKENPVNLLGGWTAAKVDKNEAEVGGGDSARGVVSWSPPQANWNAWKGCIIGDGPLSTATLEDTSRDLLEARNLQLEHPNMKQIMDERNSLPIADAHDAILEAVRDHSVVLIRGETGSGKTTQVPQYILDYFIQQQKGANCNIIVTQPQDICAVTAADRVAHERNEELGVTVGYSVRFECTMPRPYGGLLYCSVGTLLRKLENGLRGVSHIVVDEIQERDINTDFLLVLLRDMVLSFPDIRVVLMSATVDTTLFSEYFVGCKVLEVCGRVHPVQEYYLEDIIQMLDFTPPPPDPRKNWKGKEAADSKLDEMLNDDDEKEVEEEPTEHSVSEENCNMVVGNEYSEKTRRSMALMSEREISYEILEALLLHIKEMNIPGAILVLVSEFNIVNLLCRHLSKHPLFGSEKYAIVTLYAQNFKEEQKKAFDPVPADVTKIILSTNIAESCVTINDVVFVIDTAKVKLKLFTSHNTMTNYTSFWCSKTNLEQRRGRAGRVRPGFSFHLIGRARLERLDQYIIPAIFRTPLDELCLTIKLLRLGAIGPFLSRAIEPPPIDAVVEALALLREMNALTTDDELTPLGKVLARLPIEPRLGKMCVYGCLFGYGDAACSIAAVTSLHDPIMKMVDSHKKMSKLWHSDHLALLNLLQVWEDARAKGVEDEIQFSNSRKIALNTLRMTFNGKRELSEILLSCGFSKKSLEPRIFDFQAHDDSPNIVITIVALSLFPNICYHVERRKFRTREEKLALVHQSSVNAPYWHHKFTQPLFVFDEKRRSGPVMCFQLSMITSMQLLMSAARNATFDGNRIIINEWISLKMDPELAMNIIAVRPMLDELLMRSVDNPEQLSTMSETDSTLISLIQLLSRHNLSHITQIGDDEDSSSGVSMPASKRPRLSLEEDDEEDEEEEEDYGSTAGEGYSGY